MSTIIELYATPYLIRLGYLETFDPDAGTDTITGCVTTTWNIDRAMRFESIANAIAYVMTQSKRVPLRPDGKSNRPLTAFTMEFKNANP
jgi:hypothetical protein